MDPRKNAPEYTLELFAVDVASVRDIVRGVLHMIFFHRHFPLIRPGTIDVLDMTLPSVPIPELESLIDSRAYQLSRQLSSAGVSSGGTTAVGSSGGRGQLQIRFLEKRRKTKAERAGGGLAWFGMGMAGGGRDEEICWETWNIKVTLATPRTEIERQKALRAMETTLQRTALKVMAIANQDKEHIPAITHEAAFPYQIVLNPRIEARGLR